MTVSDIVLEAESWIGTPYKYGACCKGKGIDCARYIAQVFKNIGILRRGYEPPAQHRDWVFGKNVDKKIFAKELLKYSDKISIDDRQAGDIISFIYAGLESHLGIIVYNDCFVHAPSGRKVMKNKVKTFYDKICSIYRVRLI